MTDILDSIHLMVDIETASTRENAAVLAIALVPFCYTENKFRPTGEMIAYPSLPEQFFKGAHFDTDTQKWWMKQSPEAQEDIVLGSMLAGNTTIKDTLNDISQFIKSYRSQNHNKKLYIWCQGTDFDKKILESLYRQYPEIEIPWKYYEWLDCRTVEKISGITRDKSKTQHMAIQDCIDQIERLNEAFRKMGRFSVTSNE